jgi:DNA-binding transcriptional regulator GbsR (MarR family)
MSELTATQRMFILHWGEMGSRWGIGRTAAQIQALLYLSPAPMHAAAIAEVLAMARSNVSISLKELQIWGLVKLASVLGDRKDHFESLKDPLDIAQAVLRERRRREFDPTLQMLRIAAQESQTPLDSDETRERLARMLKFFEESAALHDALERVPDGVAKRFIRGKGRWKDLLAP